MASGKAITLLEQQNAALKMRQRGWRYGAIAEELGITPQRAAGLVKAALEDYDSSNEDAANQEREVLIARAEAAILAISEEVEAGNLYAIDRMIKLQEQIAVLRGLRVERKDITTAGQPLPGFTAEAIQEAVEKAKSELAGWITLRSSLPSGEVVTVEVEEVNRDS